MIFDDGQMAPIYYEVSEDEPETSLFGGVLCRSPGQL